MKPLQLVLGAVLVLLIGALLLWYSLGPGTYVRPQPLDPTTATSTSPPTAVTSSAPNGTVVPSTITTTTPQPPATASGAPNGNGNGGDALPVREPGRVTFFFTLPEGADQPEPSELVITATGDTSSTRPQWVRKAGVQKRSKQPFQATLDSVPPGGYRFAIDAPGIGSWGVRELTVRGGAVTEVQLGVPAPMAAVTLDVRRRDGRAVRFSAALSSKLNPGFGGAQEADGRVTLPCLPGDYVVRVWAGGFAPVYRSITAGASAEPISIVLDKGATLVLMLSNREGQPARERYVRLVDGLGARHELWMHGAQAGRRFIMFGGSLKLPDVPLGRWEVEVSTRPRDAASWKRLGPVLLEAGQRLEQRFTVDD